MRVGQGRSPPQQPSRQQRLHIPPTIRGQADDHPSSIGLMLSTAVSNPGNLSDAEGFLDEFQKISLRAADGYRELTVFVSMLSGEGDGAFPVDQSCDVGGVYRGQVFKVHPCNPLAHVLWDRV